MSTNVISVDSASVCTVPLDIKLLHVFFCPFKTVLVS